MQSTLLLLALAAMGSSMVIYDIRDTKDDGNSTLIERDAQSSPYGLGINVYTNKGCAGTVVSQLNHDAYSCNYGYQRKTAYQWISARPKPDGIYHGMGCISIYSNADCSGQIAYGSLDGKSCYDWGFNANCIVVASRNPDNTCGVNHPTC